MRALEDGVFEVFKVQNDDIFYLQPDDSDRINFLQNCYKIVPENPEDFQRRIDILYQCISLAVAVAYRNKHKEGFISKAVDF
jgi:hypothetical protein